MRLEDDLDAHGPGPDPPRPGVPGGTPAVVAPEPAVTDVPVVVCRRRTIVVPMTAASRPAATSAMTRMPVESPVFGSGTGAAWSLPVGAAGSVGFEAAGPGLSGLTSAVSAATGLTMPYPYWSSRPGAPLSVAVAVNRWMTSLAERPGYFDRTSAAVPATMAVASLVPVPMPYPWLMLSAP